MGSSSIPLAEARKQRIGLYGKEEIMRVRHLSIVLLFTMGLGLVRTNAGAQDKQEKIIGIIELERTPTNLFTAKVKIGDSDKFTFLVDTGATNTIVSSALVSKLKLKTKPAVEADGKPLTMAFPKAENPLSVELESMTVLPSVPVAGRLSVLVWDAEKLNLLAGRPIDGVLGMNVFRLCLTLFDFRKNRIKMFYPPELSEMEMKAEEMDMAVEIPADVDGTRLRIPVSIGENKPFPMFITTGALHSGVSADVAHEQILVSTEEATEPTLSGPILFLHARAPKITLGLTEFVEFKDLIVRYPREDLPGWPPQVGLDLLTQGRLILDAPHKRVLFKKY